MLSDIAEGMMFMESVHWVHGDLAARNLLMGANKVVQNNYHEIRFEKLVCRLTTPYRYAITRTQNIDKPLKIFEKSTKYGLTIPMNPAELL